MYGDSLISSRSRKNARNSWELCFVTGGYSGGDFLPLLRLDARLGVAMVLGCFNKCVGVYGSFDGLRRAAKLPIFGRNSRIMGTTGKLHNSLVRVPLSPVRKGRCSIILPHPSKQTLDI
uniref:Uncharacterized protein n=1 Tax=Coccidioides posadasii RMSCC 3488 TaxID=454284 RepID=A0A0J6FTE7_COCPO|nr:hypothetical protein CPAG_08688 [Coccidioides posadasii RMSCC 3488]